MRPPPSSPRFPYTTLFRSTDPTPDPADGGQKNADGTPNARATYNGLAYIAHADRLFALGGDLAGSHRGFLTRADILWTFEDRKSTRLNSSHLGISYAVFCL